MISITLSLALTALDRPVTSHTNASPQTVTTPPADWRMPATVSTSSGLSGDQAALAAANVDATSKNRPTITLADGASEHIEWTVAEAGDALLSFAFGADLDTATFAVSLDGVDQGFAPFIIGGGNPGVVEGGTGIPIYRQFIRLSVAAGQVIRLTITTSGDSVVFYPLLHKMPASGPADTHLTYGASREQDAWPSIETEEAIIAAFPGRDPVVFCHARGGWRIDELVNIADDARTLYTGVVSYAYCGGSMLTNNVIQNRPYHAGEDALILSSLNTIRDEFAAAGFEVCFSSTAFGDFGGVDREADQDEGSLPYDLNVLFPWISTNYPAVWDSTYQRPRVDAYLLTLKDRGNLADSVHANLVGRANERTLGMETWWNYIYTGSWSYTPQALLRVQEAEAEAGVEANLHAAWLEATYALAALPSTATKTALQTRVDALAGEALFYDAKVMIGAAESARTQEAIDDAQAALDAAVAAGYVDQASPNTITEQQARLNAVTAPSFDQRINIDFGGDPADPQSGWNRFTDAGANVKFTDMVDENDAATGAGLEFGNAWSGVWTSNELNSAVPDRVPNFALRKSIFTSGINRIVTITGLDLLRTYKVSTMAARSSTGNQQLVEVSIGGVTAQPVYAASGNESNLNSFSGIAPNAFGEIEITITKGDGASNIFFAAIIVEREAV